MRCRKPGNAGYFIVGLVLLAFPIAASTQQIHRNGFEGKQPFWLRGEGNLKADEKSHSITDANAHRGTTSEQIILACETGKNDANFVYYTYKTPQAPVTDELTASVYIRGNRPGVQLLARLVIPRERDPQNIGEPLTVLLQGDTLKQTRTWQRLDLSRPKKLMQDKQQQLRQELKKDIDLADAYIDRLMLNLYTGPGTTEVQIDDLEISPVLAASVAAPAITGERTSPDFARGHVTPPGAGTATPLAMLARNTKGQSVRFESGRIRIDGQPFFPRIIRYSGGDLKELKAMGFNAVYIDANADPKMIEEAVGNGLWLVPQMPLLDDGPPTNKLTSRAMGEAAYPTNRGTEALTTALTKFNAGNDGVLFYDLGPGRSTEQFGLVARTSDAIRAADPVRPRSADVWDGFRRYSTQVEMISTHRNPLLTSLELPAYRDFLMQRGRLAGDGVFTWSWVQTHVPDWQVKLLTGRETANDLNESFNPTPEQIRLLTYIGIASGSKGVGYWSDRFLTDPRHGRERLLMMALLNSELTMLEPVLQSIRSAPTWHEVPGNPNVKFAVLRGERGILVLPIWMGSGSQYVPPQGAVAELSITVPMAPTSMAIWEISPGRVQSLQLNSKEVVGGTKIVIPEFDLTSAIVFTNDQEPNGLVARWQDHTRKVAHQAAAWAVELADLQYQRVSKQHAALEGVAPPVEQAGQLLYQSQQRLEIARGFLAEKKDEFAFMEAMRSMRPLRILMRAQWEGATKGLDFASASPYAVSYQTLPQHYRLQQQLADQGLGANLLRDGDFESSAMQATPVSSGAGKPPEGFATPTGWSVQKATLDAVEMEASVISSKVAFVPPFKKIPELKRDRYAASSLSRIPEKSDPPSPELGDKVLRLLVKPKEVPNPSGKKLYAPSILERTFLAVHSPPVRLQPGSWVRISGWVYIAAPITATADGLLVYDSVGGESMGLRMTEVTKGWKPFHLYRKVPESGSIWLTVALTGLGQAFVDDLKIEPYLNGPGEK